MPRLHEAVADTLAQQSAHTDLDGANVDDYRQRPEIPPFLRIGSWIGGDRGGNPNITEHVLRATLARHCGKVLGYYEDQLEKLEGELSLSSILVKTSPELKALAEEAVETSAHRDVEPYRRSISAIRAKLKATAAQLCPDGAIAGSRSRAPAAYHKVQRPSKPAWTSSISHLLTTGPVC